MTEINRSRVKSSFSRQAETYDSLARVQQRVLERFMDIFMKEGDRPGSLLDVGAGTGALMESLCKRYPDATIWGADLAHGMARVAYQRLTGRSNGAVLCGDAEALPFKDNSFSHVISTSTYQWLYPFNSAFAEALRVLEPGGRFCTALFGQKTLFELRTSYKKALASLEIPCPDRTHVFAAEDEVLTSLKNAGFLDCHIFSEDELELHADVPAMMRSLKNIGAGNASTVSGKGLSGRKLMSSMMENYRADYGLNGSIPATYQVLYCSGVKPIQQPISQG